MVREEQNLSGLVELDGHRFIRCKFQHATLIYRGGKIPQMIDCSFDPAQIEFQDAAADTVRLLAAMSHPGSGLRYLVARMFLGILSNASS